ncbi:hypothetical protein ZWY2020_003204 [Hordeum vulgare]|nr:hypothetical protein ZWY2020_003204 [Hordeum vulgare]
MPRGRGCFGRRWFGCRAGSSRRGDGVGGNRSRCGGGAAPACYWSSSLTGPQTVDIYRHGIMVPPSCRLAHWWHVVTDGYATPGPAQAGPWNPEGRQAFWEGRDFDTVVTFYKSRGLRADGQNAPVAPPAVPALRPVRRARAPQPLSPRPQPSHRTFLPSLPLCRRKEIL